MATTTTKLKTLYNETLLPKLKKLDKHRKRIRTKVIIWIPWGIMWGTILVIADLSDDLTLFFLALSIGGITGLIIPCYYIFKDWENYQSSFKKHIIQKVIHLIDETLTYEPENHIPQSTFEKSKIFRRTIALYIGDDLIKGAVNKTPFTCSELDVDYGYPNDTRSSKRLFKGLFCCIEFNKHFKGETFILTDKIEKRFGFLSTALQKHKKEYGELVKLEDPEFELEFVVYGSNQIEPRYILSPSLMKQCVTFKKMKKKNIQCSFIENTMYVTIPYKKDLLEPKLWGSLIDFQSIETYHTTIHLIKDLIETLQLNKKIWTKE